MELAIPVWFWLIAIVLIAASWILPPMFAGLFWLGVISAVVGIVLAFLPVLGR